MSDITATSVKLTWYYKNPEEVQYYVIQHKPKHVQQAEAEISGITTMYYHVRSLSPYTEYELTVTAVNAIGRGPASAPVTVTTGETSQYSFSPSNAFLITIGVCAFAKIDLASRRRGYVPNVSGSSLSHRRDTQALSLVSKRITNTVYAQL